MGLYYTSASLDMYVALSVRFRGFPLQIDLQTFLTLTDNDLRELGISTFGARRKMLLAIAGMSEQGSQSSSTICHVSTCPCQLYVTIGGGVSVMAYFTAGLDWSSSA